MNRKTLYLLLIAAALAYILWRRQTLHTPHGRVHIPVHRGLDPLETEMEEWLSQHPNGA